MGRRLIPLPGLCLLLSLGAGSVQAAESELVSRSNEILLELQRYDTQLQDLQSRYGAFHQSLLEPLDAIVALLLEQGDFESAAEIQARQLGVMRTVLGLEHPDLIPLLRAIIETQQRLGDWQQVADNLELVRVITSAGYGRDSDQAMAATEQLAQWYLAMLYLDLDTREQARNFMRSREIYDDLQDLAEERFGEDSPELIPWHYKRAYNLVQLVGLVNTDDSLAREMVEEVVRSDGFGRLESGTSPRILDADRVFGLGRRFSVLESDQLLGEGYIRQGRGFISDIMDIAEAADDLESQGMAELYRGDFNVLGDINAGSRNYRDAREMLLQAGISQQRLDAFFALPMPIPVPHFFNRFADLEAYQQARLAQVDSGSEGRTHLGIFRAWTEAAPALERPVSADPLLNLVLPEHQVELEFRLSSRGKASAVDVISASSEERGVAREAQRALRDVVFRPYFADNRSRRLSDLQIRYVFAIEED